MKKEMRFENRGMPNIDQMGYPGTSQLQTSQLDNNQLASLVLNDINAKETREKIIMKLVTIHGKDPLEAQQFVDQMYQYLEQQESETEEFEEETLINNNLNKQSEIPELNEQPEDNQMTNNMLLENDLEDNSDQVESDIIMRHGGSTSPSKKKYVNSVLNLVKKQMGGDTSNNNDVIDDNTRQETLNRFIGAVKKESAMALIKQQVEKQYDQMMHVQQGGEQDIYQGQDYENPMHHLALLSEATSNIFQDNQNQIVQAKRGMAIQDLFPANVLPTQYTQMVKVPYDPETGKPITNYMPGVSTGIKKIDVTKKGWLTGRPKKYTVVYGTQELDPRKQNLISLNNNSLNNESKQPKKQHINMDGLSMKAKMAIRKGERQAYRDDKWLAKHPEFLQQFISNNNPEPEFNRELPIPSFTPEQQEYLKQSLTLPVMPPVYTPFSADMLYNNTGPINTEMQYGGGLQRFIPKAQDGFENPVTYTNNPALHGISQVDLLSSNLGIQGLSGNSMDNPFMNNNVPIRNQSNDPKQYTVDPNQIGSHQSTNVYQGPENDIAVDYRVRNSIDPEGYINAANAGIRGITGILNRKDAARQQARIYDNLTADNLYASDPSIDRGNYDTNSGLYRLDEMGQMWNSRSKQYGGIVEGDEIDMSEEEIEEFLANGGEIEYL